METVVLALVIVSVANSIFLVRLMRRRASTPAQRPSPPDSEPQILPLRDARYPRPYDPPSDPPRG